MISNRHNLLFTVCENFYTGASVRVKTNLQPVLYYVINNLKGSKTSHLPCTAYHQYSVIMQVQRTMVSAKLSVILG